MRAKLHYDHGATRVLEDIFDTILDLFPYHEAEDIIGKDDPEVAAHAIFRLHPEVYAITLYPEDGPAYQVHPIESDWREGFGE